MGLRGLAKKTVVESLDRGLNGKTDVLLGTCRWMRLAPDNVSRRRAGFQVPHLEIAGPKNFGTNLGTVGAECAPKNAFGST